jgi:hypothetical protein
MERGVVYSPSWDKKRAKTMYKTIDLERSCTVLYRQDREWKTMCRGPPAYSTDKIA